MFQLYSHFQLFLIVNHNNIFNLSQESISLILGINTKCRFIRILHYYGILNWPNIVRQSINNPFLYLDWITQEFNVIIIAHHFQLNLLYPLGGQFLAVILTQRPTIHNESSCQCAVSLECFKLFLNINYLLTPSLLFLRKPLHQLLCSIKLHRALFILSCQIFLLLNYLGQLSL